MQRLLSRLSFLHGIVRRVRQLRLLRVVYDRELAFWLRQLGRMFGLILAAFGFFVILWNLVLPVFLSGFSSQMPKELALEMLKLMANVSLCLIAADLTLVGLATYVMQKKADTTAPERRRLREVGQAASVTLVFLALSFLTVLASMSYLGEYATRRDFVFPLLFMVCGVVGILYLLYLNTAEQDT